VNNVERIQRFLHRVAAEDLSPTYLKGLVALAKDEDLKGAGLRHSNAHPQDVTSSVLNQTGTGSAVLHAREDLVLCGLPLVTLVLEAYDTQLAFTPHTEDGASLAAGESIGEITGPISTLLMAERVLLNFLQFLSGVASETYKYVNALGASSTKLLDTRKTTPGYRMLQKYAVACGGGWNHRLGLFDRVMLKDNHLAADQAQAGESLTDLVHRARDLNPDLLIEVEVDHLNQIPAVLAAEPDKLMLDNFHLSDLQAAVDIIGDRACTEATGNITLANLHEIAEIRVDFVSTGALVHKSVWKDIGLDWK